MSKCKHKWKEDERFNIFDKWINSLDEEVEDGEYTAASSLSTGALLVWDDDINKLKAYFNPEANK